MKAVAMFAAAMVLMTASAMQAQEKSRSYFPEPAVYKNANIPAALKAFENCLDQKNEGVQESAMAHLAMLKLMVPGVDASGIMRRLETLSTESQEPGVRFKAYLASQVYRDPELFVQERKGSYDNSEDLFNALAARLQNSLLSYNGQ